MPGRDLLDELVAQESRLVFDRFDEDTGWDLGVALRAAARAAGLPVAISIRRNGQRLFHAALAGSSADNDGWLELIQPFRDISRLAGNSLSCKSGRRSFNQDFA